MAKFSKYLRQSKQGFSRRRPSLSLLRAVEVEPPFKVAAVAVAVTYQKKIAVTFCQPFLVGDCDCNCDLL